MSCSDLSHQHVQTTVLCITCLPKLHIFDKTSILATCFHFFFELCMYKAGTITYYCSLISSYLILMLYYCVCFEASSLVISGQPFCLFLFLSTIPHHCTSVLYYLASECAALFSYQMDFKNRMTFISTLKNSHEKDHNVFYQQVSLSPRTFLLYQKPVYVTPSSV